MSFKSGFEWNLSTPVTLTIDEEVVIPDMMKNTQFSWANNDEEDERIRSLMRAGEKLVIAGRAKTGQLVEDVFALEGFTSTFTAARNACAEIYAKADTKFIHVRFD